MVTATHTTPTQSQARAAARAQWLRGAAAKLARLKMETLSLYTATEVGELFHASKARWRLADGSQRSGKTLAAAIEFARAHLACDPYKKFPKRDGRSLCIGLTQDHLAQTMFAKLFEPGGIYIIRDEMTRLWRAVRPDPNDPKVLDPYDLAYHEKWKDAPPLIPERMIVGGMNGIAWEDRKKREPRVIPFVTGWRSLWRTAAGAANPPQGDVYDFGWIDEHIDNEEFFRQMSRGFVSRGGKGVWSACPERSNLELECLRERFEAGDERVKAFTFLIDDNPYFTDEDKKSFFDDLRTDEERAVRYFGAYRMRGRRVYAHLYDPMGEQSCEPFEIPKNYARYAVVDPGHQYCGTALIAVDPEEKHWYIYDAWVLNAVDALMWAEELDERCDDVRLEAIIMDQQMGKQTNVGAGKTVAAYFWEALEKVKRTPRRQGSLNGFMPGTKDIQAREQALLGSMRIRETGPFEGTCKLQIFRGQSPEMETQIKQAQYDRNGAKRMKFVGHDELVQCAEYGIDFDPKYVEPETEETLRISRRQKRFLAIEKRIAKRSRKAGVELC